ncbi:unnamed protein product [Toxocara canis]|uniref:Uncharacterized protein n=1 Tax=Toxocara canis TaxID=6265 RepID=A0A183U7C5_TOXCA|nr:unnamed protein product [Toxocara canis]
MRCGKSSSPSLFICRCIFQPAVVAAVDSDDHIDGEKAVENKKREQRASSGEDGSRSSSKRPLKQKHSTSGEGPFEVAFDCSLMEESSDECNAAAMQSLTGAAVHQWLSKAENKITSEAVVGNDGAVCSESVQKNVIGNRLEVGQKHNYRHHKKQPSLCAMDLSTKEVADLLEKRECQGAEIERNGKEEVMAGISEETKEDTSVFETMSDGLFAGVRFCSFSYGSVLK